MTSVLPPKQLGSDPAPVGAYPCGLGVHDHSLPRLNKPSLFPLEGAFLPKLFILAAKGFPSVGNPVPKIAFLIFLYEAKKEGVGWEIKRGGFVSTRHNFLTINSFSNEAI